MKRHRVALLVRDPGRLAGFAATLEYLTAQGSVVQLFALGPAEENPGNGFERWKDWPDIAATERYTDSLDPARANGFDRLDKRGIAALIRRADVVIAL